MMEANKNLLFSGEIFIKANDIKDEKIDDKLEAVNENLKEIDKKLDSLTANVNKTDYIVSFSCGLIAAAIDSIYSGIASSMDSSIIDEFNNSGEKSLEKFVVKLGNIKGCKSEELQKNVEYLEQYEIPGDKVYNEFGGGLQHHLRDFSHHASPLGLICSILTQFTGNVYGTDVNGNFISVPLPKEDYNLIGNNLFDKINKGVFDWIFHLASDCVGASSTIRAGGNATGIPGPFLSFAKEISAIPIFKSKNKDEVRQFSKFVSKLYNGTMLGDRDENGRISSSNRFNLKTEVGIATFVLKQLFPVLLYEALVRSYYFFSRLFTVCKINNINSIEKFKKIDFSKFIPKDNRSVDRMLTISALTFTTLDTTDAAVRSLLECEGNLMFFCLGFVKRFNYVGAGRAAYAVYKEFKYDKEELEALKEKRKILEEKTALEYEKIEKFKKQLEALMCEYVIEDVSTFINGLEEIDTGLKNNDSNLVIHGNIIIQQKFGKEQFFHTQEEFDEFMESEDDFVL